MIIIDWLFKVENLHYLNIFPTSTSSPHISHSEPDVMNDQQFYDVHTFSPHTVELFEACAQDCMGKILICG